MTPMFFFHSIRDLLKFKEEVTKERDQLLSEVVKLRECLAQTVEQQQEMERSREEAEQAISQVCSGHGEKDEETSPSRRSFRPSPVSLPVLFLSLTYRPVPQMKHPWFCLFLWFVFARAVLLESFFSTVFAWEVTKTGHCLHFWPKKVSSVTAKMPCLWGWWKQFPWPFSFVRKPPSWILPYSLL